MNVQGQELSFISAFLGGVVVSFSPCVYPLIPLILSFIGVKAGTSRLRGFTLSLIYVSGLAITYSVLGLIASLTGSLFGQISNHPASFFILGNACIIAGLSFLGLFDLSFTRIRLQNKVNSRWDSLSALLLGMVSGLIAGPCVAPALGLILVYVASRQNVIHGAGLLFVFAYGVGFSLVIAGTFSSLLINFSKGQVWLERIKKVFGLVLLVLGEYFLIKAGRLM
ncbi:MAG: cytochrome c biogenesis protein CcdA [Candidatus Omnitrophica bacterium]|nr:cytochrome c biogenesis protein CcdA [Candidatus Omnitrophota bacterium]MDD5553558.1 cytochrome c biogenesis protein CcdA [Candidatus Omnitrophota bacterium]